MVQQTENYTRQQFNLLLPQVLNMAQVIVGLNNISILPDGKEIDIPILIFYNNKLYKFAVEYNGPFWHKDKIRENDKKQLIIKNKYIPFYVCPENNLTTNQIINYINNEIDKIIVQIKEIIDYKD